MVFMCGGPGPTSSLLISRGSNVSACHISSSLIAGGGNKLRRPPARGQLVPTVRFPRNCASEATRLESTRIRMKNAERIASRWLLSTTSCKHHHLSSISSQGRDGATCRRSGLKIRRPSGWARLPSRIPELTLSILQTHVECAFRQPRHSKLLTVDKTVVILHVSQQDPERVHGNARGFDRVAGLVDGSLGSWCKFLSVPLASAQAYWIASSIFVNCLCIFFENAR